MNDLSVYPATALGSAPIFSVMNVFDHYGRRSSLSSNS